MGLGDFVKGLGEAAGDIGEAVGGDWVVDQALKAPDAARNVYKAGETVAKGVSHLATNPTQIARGAGAAIQFIEDNPGKVWDTGFEVGRAIVKDQLDPVNLAINAGLIGLTVATGGAAAPALAAKLAMGARTAKVGLEAIRAGEGVAQGLRAARTASTAIRATQTAERAVGAVKAADTALDVARGVEKGTDTARAISRGDAFLGGVKRTEEGLEGGAKFMNRMMNPVSRRVEAAVQPVRNRMAERILTTSGGGEAGFVRQAGAALVQGNTGAMPRQLVGQSSQFHTLQKTMWRGRQVAAKTVGYAQTAGTAQEAYDIAARPEEYAQRKGEEAWAEHGDEITAQATPYVQQAQQARQAQDAFRTGPDRSKERDPFDPIQQPSTEAAVGLQQFRLDRTHATRTSRRQPGRFTQLGTVTDNTAMPTRIGPENWYGPQGGYDAGRGFQQREATPTMGLAPIEQPSQRRDLVGI